MQQSHTAEGQKHRLSAHQGWLRLRRIHCTKAEGNSQLKGPEKQETAAVVDPLPSEYRFLRHGKTAQRIALPRAEIARASIDNNGKIIIARDMAEGVDIANEIAPEHLEVCVDDPFSLLNSIRNAGSIFLGKNVPEALGDYFAGPNHTLPTLGTARFSSPLSVDDFVKKSSFIYYTKEALGAVQERIVDFAEREGLSAHARSVSIRFEDGQ